MDVLHQSYDTARNMPAIETIGFMEDWGNKIELFAKPISEALGKLDIGGGKPNMKEIIPKLPHPSTWVKHK